MNISKMYLHVEQLSLKTNWNWQKDSCTTKAVRKIHLELGRKGREVIRLGPPRGFGIGGGFYTGRELSKEVSGLSHVLGTPTLGSDTGKTSPLG